MMLRLALLNLYRRLFSPDAKAVPGIKGERGSWKKEWMVCPPALMAAMPVGASTIIRLGDRSRRFLRKVVLPVPAFPVRNRLALVFSMISRAVWASWFMFMSVWCVFYGVFVV